MELGYREILLDSDIEEIESLCVTDKFAHFVCQDESLWRQIYEREGVPFPRYPDKFRFYMDTLKNRYTEARKWLYYLYGQSNTYSDLQELYNDVVYEPNLPTIRIYDIDMLPQDIFDDLDVNQEFKNAWNTFYHRTITENLQRIYFIQVHFNPAENALLVTLRNTQEEFAIQYIYEDDVELFISRLLKYGAEFKDHEGFIIDTI